MEPTQQDPNAYSYKERFSNQKEYNEVIIKVGFFRKVYNIYKILKLLFRNKNINHYINEIMKDDVYVEAAKLRVNLQWELYKILRGGKRYKINTQGCNCTPKAYSSPKGVKIDCSTEEALKPDDLTSVIQAVNNVIKEKEKEALERRRMDAQYNPQVEQISKHVLVNGEIKDRTEDTLSNTIKLTNKPQDKGSI